MQSLGQKAGNLESLLLPRAARTKESCTGGEELISCLQAPDQEAGGQVSVLEDSVKIEVRKGKLLSDGMAGPWGPGQPLPQQLGRGDGTPRGSSRAVPLHALAGINPTNKPGLSAKQDQLCSGSEQQSC